MFKSIKINEILVSICLFILGLCIFIWADKVTNTISLFFGVILIIYSLFNGIIYFKNKENNVINILSTVILLVIGIILISRPSIISEIISFVVGIYILLSSLSKLNITLNNKQNNKYHLNLILSIVGILLGILCILGKILVPNLILRYLGLMLMIYSIIDIVGIKSIKFIKK